MFNLTETSGYCKPYQKTSSLQGPILQPSLTHLISHSTAVLLQLLPPATKLGQGNIFWSVCQQFCPQGGGGHAWFYSGGACVVLFGGACVVLFRGCVVLFGGHAWFYLGVCVVLFGGACMVLFGGACVVLFRGSMCGFIRGHAWFYSGGRAWFFQFFRIQWDTVNERAVRILLECILVFTMPSTKRTFVCSTCLEIYSILSYCWFSFVIRFSQFYHVLNHSRI